MKPKRIFLTVASAAALAAAGMYPVSVITDWFSQTFDGLSDGTSFTGTQGGTTGGTWATIDAGVATVDTVAGRKCIDVNTMKPSGEDAPIRFTANGSSDKSIERFEFAVCTEPMPWYPMVESGEKGALVLMSNDGGLLAFGGYTASGWKTVYGHGFTQQSRQWIDCRAEFDYSVTPAQVSYFAKLGEDDEYQPLVTTDGIASFNAANSSTRAKVIAFSGKGGVGKFSGHGLAYDKTENNWQGPANGDWDTASNWSRNKVPAYGEVAAVKSGSTIRRTIGGKIYTIVVNSATKIVIESDMRTSFTSGEVKLFGDFTAWGTIVIATKTRLVAEGTFYGLEMGYASTLQIDPKTNVVVRAEPIHLDGVNVNLTTEPHESREALSILTGPYGSGGDLLSLKAGIGVDIAWSAAWHGKLDGTSALWLVNKNYQGAVAVWNDGTWGNLANESNWGATKPADGRAAQVRNGQAHVNQWDTFGFARRFDIGALDDKSGEVDMSGGTVRGTASETAGAAVAVGTERGSGVLDIVGGTVRPFDHLWNYALTVGTEPHAAGTVKVRGGILDAAGGGVSVGAAGAAQMEICEGRATVGGPFAVGYAGKLDVTGGSLTVSNAVYIGRTTRDEPYDVAMTVAGGTVSNVSQGAFCVGSFGGVGSKATLTLADGVVSAVGRLVCGGYRSARVDVTGGTLVAPEICVGQDLVDAEDTAAFNLVSGRVVTAGFTAGDKGTRTVSLADGVLTATAANDDFFKGLDVVRLGGETKIENAEDVTVRAGLTGPGGFVKTGAGTLRLGGYAAWAGKTVVAAGTLDMGGGMILGGLEVAEGASVVNAKYDNIDALSFKGENWTTGTASTRPYLQITATKTASASSAMQATDADGVLKGAISFAAAEGGMAFKGWTAFGWTELRFADGTAAAAGTAYELQMRFDFNGKQYYVFYYAKRGGTYERLVSADGLTAFPVAGASASVKTFDGTGLQLTVDDTRVSRWIGGPSGKWNVAANWSSSVPKSGARAFVDTSATIDVSGAAAESPAAMLVVNARVTLVGGTLQFADRVCGAGTLVLSNATVAASLVELPVESAFGTDNAVGMKGATLNGAIRGAGTLSVSGSIAGDTQAFAGTLKLLEGGIVTAAAANNAKASWQIADKSYPFAADSADYAFGALGGTIAAQAGDADDVVLTIGMRNEDCSLAGGWPNASRAEIDWVAPSARLTYAVANAARLGIAGGTVSIGAAGVLPPCVSFTGNGGTLSFAEGAACDPSAALKDSTAAMAFDDGGFDSLWGTALDASNVGGFVKRGAGTLTLAAAPQYKGATVVEEGVLVVPFGTRLENLTVARDGKVVLDMGGTGKTGIALAIARANRELLLFDGKYFSISNAPADYKLDVTDNNGLVVSVGTDSFVWKGGVDSQWENVGNWTVGGKPATRIPAEQDDVRFYSTAMVSISAPVKVRNLVGDADLTIQGAESFSAAGTIRLPSGNLSLDGNVKLDAADVSIATLSGTGTVAVASGTLTVSPEGGIDAKFIGTLNVTNFVKAGEGTFEYEPLTAFSGTMSVAGGTMRWNCTNGVTRQTSVALTMLPDTCLNLCGQTVTVGSFTGAGMVENKVLLTADGVVTQYGGDLTIPAVNKATYVASHAGEKLVIADAEDMDIRIVIPRTWFVAGVSGKRAIQCAGRIIWDIQSKTATEPVSEGDAWWSIAGGGLTLRLR